MLRVESGSVVCKAGDLLCTMALAAGQEGLVFGPAQGPAGLGTPWVRSVWYPGDCEEIRRMEDVCATPANRLSDPQSGI